jgi:hypothetical protein
VEVVEDLSAPDLRVMYADERHLVRGGERDNPVQLLRVVIPFEMICCW